MKRPDREPDYICVFNDKPWSYFWFEEMCACRRSNEFPLVGLAYHNNKLFTLRSAENEGGVLIDKIQDAYHEWQADKAVEEYLLT